MVCRRGGFIIQRHNELRDLEAEIFNMVYNDVETEPVLQEINGEILNRGAKRAPDARLDISVRDFWEMQRSAFFDVRVCNPNVGSYRDLSPKEIYRQHEKEKTANMQAGYGRWSKAPLRHLFLLPQAEWTRNVRDT